MFDVVYKRRLFFRILAVTEMREMGLYEVSMSVRFRYGYYVPTSMCVR